MAALAHSLCGLQLVASPLRSDVAILVHSLSGEEKEVEGDYRLDLAPSGWAFLRSTAKGDARWVNDVLEVAAARAPDERIYLSGGRGHALAAGRPEQPRAPLRASGDARRQRRHLCGEGVSPGGPSLRLLAFLAAARLSGPCGKRAIDKCVLPNRRLLI